MRSFKILSFLMFTSSLKIGGLEGACQQSQTTAKGSHAPKEICSGQLIFEENFDKLDQSIWKRENTLSGGGNHEFEWYTLSDNNSYTKDSALFIKPTFVSDTKGEGFLSSGTLDLGSSCTDNRDSGCKKTGNQNQILNPIQSGKLTTTDSFSFKYGKLEVKAQVPAGDWLWPAIWLLPKNEVYGSWPASGEIDLMESRGNKIALIGSTNIGSQQVASTLHWGPNPSLNRFSLTHYEKNDNAGFDTSYHTFTLLWTPKDITFIVDGAQIGKVTPPAGGFWELGHLEGSGATNPWKTQMAPFDNEFYILLNLAVGGTNGFFPENANYGPNGKAWKDSDPNAITQFWNNRRFWDPTWQRNDPNSHSQLRIDYIKVWAL